MTNQAPKNDDPFAVYLSDLITSTQCELSSLEAAQASVNAQTDGLRQLLEALEENDGVREQLFRWIADRRPHAFARFAAGNGLHDHAITSRWDERLVTAIQTAQSNKAAAAGRVSGHITQQCAAEVAVPPPVNSGAMPSHEPPLELEAAVRSRFAN
jgi:hypothetical protein